MNKKVDPSITVAKVWDALLGLGYTRVRRDRAEKGRYGLEVGYGSSTVRVRMYHDREFLKRWDLNAVEDDADRLALVVAEAKKLGEKKR